MQLETSCFGIQWPLNSLSHFSVLCSSLPLYPEDTLWVTLDEVRLLEKLELSWLSYKIFSLGSFFVECKQTCKQRLTSFTALSLAYLEWKILSSEVNATKHEKKNWSLDVTRREREMCIFNWAWANVSDKQIPYERFSKALSTQRKLFDLLF